MTNPMTVETRCNACNGLIEHVVYREDEHVKYVHLKCENCGVLPEQPGVINAIPKHDGDIYINGVFVGKAGVFE